MGTEFDLCEVVFFSTVLVIHSLSLKIHTFNLFITNSDMHCNAIAKKFHTAN